MKTFQLKAKDIKRETHTLDASELPLGRLSARIATLLMGKHKTTYTPHMDMGDKVIVKNAEKVVLTGKKMDQKVYQKHSMYPGGYKEVAVAKLQKENPARIIELAVKRMLPKNRLTDVRMRRLEVYRRDVNGN